MRARLRGWRACGLGATLLAAALPGPAGAEPCAAAASETALIRAVEGSDLRLDDGRLLRLAGIVAQDGDGVPGLPADLAGRTIAWAPLAVADRYGRLVALVRMSPTDEVLQRHLLERGLAVLAPDHGSPEGLSPGCRAELAAAERRGRAAEAGVWRLFPLNAADVATVARFSGRFAVLAGDVVRTGRTQARDYLDFGRQWRKDVTVELPRASRAAFSASGKDSQRLVMHRIEARGLIFASGGPALEAWAPEQLDDVGPAAAREGRAGRILTREGDEP